MYLKFGNFYEIAQDDESFWTIVWNFLNVILEQWMDDGMNFLLDESWLR